MPDLSSRIRAATIPVVMVALAGMVAVSAKLASNERTLDRRVEIAKAEAEKARNDLKAAEIANAVKHEASLADRGEIKAVQKSVQDLVAENRKRIDALEARVKALEGVGP